MDAKKTGCLISDARKEKGLTQKELAQKLHISDRTISKWERGVGFPDVTMLEPLSDELGLSVQCLLSGERENISQSDQNEEALRDAIKIIYEQSKNKLRKNISTIIASAFLLVVSGLFIFAALDYMGVFLKDISCEIPAIIYENGEQIGETVVTIDGSLNVIGERSFQGKFSIEGIDDTNRNDVLGHIYWDSIAKGYQEIRYYRHPGRKLLDVGINNYLYISPNMQSFALELEDGRIIATDDYLAELQGIDGYRYAISYTEWFYD